jgi:hypothetical protein
LNKSVHAIEGKGVVALHVVD